MVLSTCAVTCAFQCLLVSAAAAATYSGDPLLKQRYLFLNGFAAVVSTAYLMVLKK